MVALGKFDAMHRGHAELAARAARMGSPYLMSFGGMAEVLGWAPKLPVVAPSDRARVLASWSDACDGKVVREHVVPFAAIRRMSPEEFVATLRDLGVGGVVAGRNYRFGFKAVGDADALTELGEKLGVEVAIVDLLDSGEEGTDGDDTPQVSSTRVRACLASGDVAQAARLLGRPHRLALSAKDARSGPAAAAFPLAAAMCQPPAKGRYVGEVIGAGGERRRAMVTVTEEEVVVEGGATAAGGDAAGGDAAVLVDVLERAER